MNNRRTCNLAYPFSELGTKYIHTFRDSLGTQVSVNMDVKKVSEIDLQR
jgi:hypothetical protein